MSEPCLPSSPKPHASAAGIMLSVLAQGPECAFASQPCPRMKFVSFIAARAPRL
ncbi:MAG TPA: hypothetical protein VLC47_10025 [Burkholderiales bacterium]|nr:hypothetical protein [Burkholderiales bacterium]